MSIFTAPGIIVAILTYLIGSINISIILAKKMAGIDIRKQGSGNAGSTNMLRTLGKKAGAITLIGDLAKGLIAILIAYIVSLIVKGDSYVGLSQIAGVCVILGHNFPLYYGFKGGKGIATSLGVILAIDPKIGGMCLLFAIIIIAITRMVSVGSILAAILFPILTLFTKSQYFIFSLIIALLILYMHRTNIKRILSGEENKIGSKK